MKFTNKYNLPESLVNCITNDTYDLNKTDENTISITTLINEPKIRQLKLRYADQIEEDISEQIWRVLGQSVHAILDRVELENSLKEERITIEKYGMKISGKSDLYHNEQISDYKVTSVWSIIFSPEGKPEWEEQLNCYAWLYRQSGFTVNSLQIIAILRDWAKRDIAKKNYPQIPVAVQNIKLWTTEQQENYIKTRAEEHLKYKNIPDDEIPTCIDTWKDKKCQDYCSVNKFCNYFKTLTKKECKK
jgi:hypothetical protein